MESKLDADVPMNERRGAAILFALESLRVPIGQLMLAFGAIGALLPEEDVRRNAECLSALLKVWMPVMFPNGSEYKTDSADLYEAFLACRETMPEPVREYLGMGEDDWPDEIEEAE